MLNYLYAEIHRVCLHSIPYAQLCAHFAHTLLAGWLADVVVAVAAVGFASGGGDLVHMAHGTLNPP